MNRTIVVACAVAAVALGGCGVSEDTTAASPQTLELTQQPSTPEPLDTDGDGIPDSEDDFPDNPDAFDDQDRDGNGVNNGIDFDPDDPNVQKAPDIDSDGVTDSEDAFPKNPKYSQDSDGDRVPNSQDDYPNDPTRSVKPEVTLAQQNELRSARQYLDDTAFSKRTSRSIGIRTVLHRRRHLGRHPTRSELEGAGLPLAAAVSRLHRFLSSRTDRSIDLRRLHPRASHVRSRQDRSLTPRRRLEGCHGHGEPSCGQPRTRVSPRLVT